MHHAHPTGPVPLSPVARWSVIGLLTAIGIAVVAALIALWPSDSERPMPAQFAGPDGGPIAVVDGEVVSQVRGECLSPFIGTTGASADFAGLPDDGEGPCILNTVRIDSGQEAGRFTLVAVPTNAAQTAVGPDHQRQTGDPDAPQAGQPDLTVGDTIRLSETASAYGGNQYTFFDFQRSTAIWWWAAAFAIAVVAVAAWRGLRALIGLGVAFAVLALFALPAILDGTSPVLVAVVASAAILYMVLYLAHGVSLRTSSALLGTLTSLAVACVLSWLAIETMELTGLVGEQVLSLQLYQGTISINGLLLAGFIIGTLGVLNDVTITQASAAFELAHAGENRRTIFTAAMRVGRDHIASTVYTLVFAYAGSALPLLLLFSVAQQPAGTLLTTETIAVELARSFVGGIIIALSVPLTTAVAAALCTPAGAEPEAEVEAAPAH